MSLWMPLGFGVGQLRSVFFPLFWLPGASMPTLWCIIAATELTPPGKKSWVRRARG